MQNICTGWFSATASRPGFLESLANPPHFPYARRVIAKNAMIPTWEEASASV